MYNGGDDGDDYAEIDDAYDEDHEVDDTDDDDKDGDLWEFRITWADGHLARLTDFQCQRGTE